MAKTYSVSGPIMLEKLNNTDALAFCVAAIDAIPAYSMGTASLNISAQGPAGASSASIKGSTLETLKAALEKAQKTMAASASSSAADISYDVRGSVSLVGLSFADGIGVVDAVLHAIPSDSLVVTTMMAQEETPTSSPPSVP
jgi:hypothetical protein